METVNMKDVKPLKEHVDDIVQYVVREISEIYKQPHVTELELLNLLKRGHQLNQDPDEIIICLLVEKVVRELYCNIPDIVFNVHISTRYGSRRMVISCQELQMCYIVAPKCITTMHVAFVGGRRNTKTEVYMDVFALNTLGVELFTDSDRRNVPKSTTR